MKKKIKNFLFLLIATPLVLLDELIDAIASVEKPSKDYVGEILACIGFVIIIVGGSALIWMIG